jgi:hypothetical protein
MYGTFRGLTPAWNADLPTATFWWPVNRDWRQWGPIGISGDWRLQGDGGRLQLLAIPRSWGVRPEHLDFGPGWSPYRVWTDDPDWVFFSRWLNADGTISLYIYQNLPAPVRRDWSRFRYGDVPAFW